MSHHHSDGPKYCTFCNEECEVNIVDEGIGAYEYWGSKEVDIKLVEVSACCGEDVTDELPEEDE
jgi:hypothetical protein